MQHCVWDVVVVMAVSAMDSKRHFMAAAQKRDPGVSHTTWAFYVISPGLLLPVWVVLLSDMGEFP